MLCRREGSLDPVFESDSNPVRTVRDDRDRAQHTGAPDIALGEVTGPPGSSGDVSQVVRDVGVAPIAPAVGADRMNFVTLNGHLCPQVVTVVCILDDAVTADDVNLARAGLDERHCVAHSPIVSQSTAFRVAIERFVSRVNSDASARRGEG